MKFSVFTPSHKPEKLVVPAASLKKQTCQDFEWIILINGEGLKTQHLHEAAITEIVGQAKFVKFEEDSDYIGLLKNRCCEKAEGSILVELDHDDALEPTCLEELGLAFEDPSVDFCYSDFFEWKEGKTIAPYSKRYGWKYTTLPDGKIIVHSSDPGPLGLSYIWFAPNHVRAWRRSFYDAIGGHNVELEVCDDFELVCRTYTTGTCHHIKKPLYNYYLGGNTCFGNKNQKIQELTRTLHDQWIEKIILRWCGVIGLKKVDLCSGNKKPIGYIGVDKSELPNIDVVFDLDEPNWPFEDDSVGIFRAYDAIEHLRDPIRTMKEIYRCLAPYGWVLIEVPSTDGRGAFQDPTHRSFWNSNSMWYYTRKQQADFIGSPVKFQLNRVIDYYPTKWYEDHNILYTRAHLVKLLDDDFIPPKGREI